MPRLADECPTGPSPGLDRVCHHGTAARSSDQPRGLLTKSLGIPSSGTCFPGGHSFQCALFVPPNLRGIRSARSQVGRRGRGGGGCRGGALLGMVYTPWGAGDGASRLPGSFTSHPKATSIPSLSCCILAATVLFQLETLHNAIPQKRGKPQIKRGALRGGGEMAPCPHTAVARANPGEGMQRRVAGAGAGGGAGGVI